MKEDFPETTQILASYLNQDWPFEFSDDIDAFRTIIKEVSSESIFLFLNEIDSIIESDMSNEEIEDLILRQIGCEYIPYDDRINYRQWLSRINDYILNYY